jgi:hypothetical protein
MKSALPNDLPPSIRSEVINGSWERGQPGREQWDSGVLDAKMKGIRAVFITLVPIVGLCLLGCYFIPSKELPGDPKRSETQSSGQERATPRGQAAV